MCTVTGEPLTRMFEPDVGRWYYEDAVRIDGKLVKSSVANKEVCRLYSAIMVIMLRQWRRFDCAVLEWCRSQLCKKNVVVGRLNMMLS